MPTAHARGRGGALRWVVLGLWVAGICGALGAQEPLSGPAGSSLDWLAQAVGRHGLWVGLVAVFAGGLALNLTPCVYPMIPVTLAFFSAQASGAVRRRRSILLAAVYVLGLSVSYALLGLLAAQTGALLGGWLQQPVVLVGIALVVVALALSMFGLYELRLPQAVTGRVSHASTGLWGALVMGLVVGVVAAPCIGPFVLSLLLLAGQLANPLEGFLLFFVLGLGMGLPYLVLGAAAHRLARLPHAGPWLVWCKKLLGIVLLGLALYFVRSLLPAPLAGGAVIGLLAGGGMSLGWVGRAAAPGRRFVWVRRGVGATLILAAVLAAWPRPRPSAAVAWVPYSEAVFGQARREGRRIVIDVYADWCLPCVEMDHVTFRHPEVARALSEVSTLRLDATREIPPEGEALLTRYHIFGAPTVLLFDRSGRERTDLRLLGFANPDEFLARLSKLE